MEEIKSQNVILCILSFLLLAYPLAGQDNRFSGQWVLNHDKTQLAQMPDITIEISQAKGVIHYRRIVKNSKNEWLTQMDLTADGKEGSYTDYQGNRLKCSGAFYDGNLTLTYQSRQMRSGKWVILDMKEEHSVSADGNMLSIDHTESWDGKRGKFPRPMVFNRLSGDAGKVQDAKMLNTYLGWVPLLKELLPEWQDPSNLRVQLELADGRTQDRSFALRDKNAAPLIRVESKLQVPSMEKTQFAYRFLSPEK